MGTPEDLTNVGQCIVAPDLETVKAGLDAIEQRIDRLEQRQDPFEGRIDRRFDEVMAAVNQRMRIKFNAIEQRLSLLESSKSQARQ